MGVFTISDKKYPTAYTNPDSWTTPANATLAEDAACALKPSVNLATKRLPLSTYGFALPLDAILDHIYLDHKGYVNETFTIAAGLVFEWIAVKGSSTITLSDNPSLVGGGNCPQTAYAGEVDILPRLQSNLVVPSVSDINNETNWSTQILATPDANSPIRFYVDAAYIRIVWHHECKRRNLIGVGR